MTPRIRRLVELEQEKTALSDRLLQESTRALELENSLQKSELELLQARINPHFMFNALASIGSLARLEDAGRTARSVDSLARIMRHSFAADREHATVGEELEIVRHYLALQKTRFGARLCFEVECSAEVADRSLPGLSVQPFVENAVLHGIEPREQGGNVAVKACRDDAGGTLIVISDDGVGFDPARPASPDPGLDGNRSHYGITNVKRRLELLFGEGTVRIESGRGRGTMVELRIPAPPFAGGQTDLPLEQA
jgi:sensor histidine kinase YesM